MHHLTIQDNFNIYAHLMGPTEQDCLQQAALWVLGMVHQDWDVLGPEGSKEQQHDARHLAGLYLQGEYAQIIKWMEAKGQLSFSGHQAPTYHGTDQAKFFLPAQYWRRPSDLARTLAQVGQGPHKVVLRNDTGMEVAMHVPAGNPEDAVAQVRQVLAHAENWHPVGDGSQMPWFRVGFDVPRLDFHQSEVWVQAPNPEEAEGLALQQLGHRHLTGAIRPGLLDHQNSTATFVERAEGGPHPSPLQDTETPGPWLLTFTSNNHLTGPVRFDLKENALDCLRECLLKALKGSLPEELWWLRDTPASNLDERRLGEVVLSTPWSYRLQAFRDLPEG